MLQLRRHVEGRRDGRVLEARQIARPGGSRHGTGIPSIDARVNHLRVEEGVVRHGKPRVGRVERWGVEAKDAVAGDLVPRLGGAVPARRVQVVTRPEHRHADRGRHVLVAAFGGRCCRLRQILRVTPSPGRSAREKVAAVAVAPGAKITFEATVAGRTWSRRSAVRAGDALVRGLLVQGRQSRRETAGCRPASARRT